MNTWVEAGDEPWIGRIARRLAWASLRRPEYMRWNGHAGRMRTGRNVIIIEGRDYPSEPRFMFSSCIWLVLGLGRFSWLIGVVGLRGFICTLNHGRVGLHGNERG